MPNRLVITLLGVMALTGCGVATTAPEPREQAKTAPAPEPWEQAANDWAAAGIEDYMWIVDGGASSGTISGRLRIEVEDGAVRRVTLTERDVDIAIGSLSQVPTVTGQHRASDVTPEGGCDPRDGDGAFADEQRFDDLGVPLLIEMDDPCTSDDGFRLETVEFAPSVSTPSVTAPLLAIIDTEFIVTPLVEVPQLRITSSACLEGRTVDIHEDDFQIVVTVRVPAANADTADCTRSFLLRPHEPLGDRRLVDGATGSPVPDRSGGSDDVIDEE